MDQFHLRAPPDPVVSFDIPKTALVIARGADAVEFVASACRRGGFVLHYAMNADAATEFLSRTLTSLIVMDAPAMPGESLEWVRRVRSDPRTSRIPIVLTSPLTSVEAVVAALDAGADDYASRQSSTDELLARIRTVVRCRAPELAGDEIVFGPLIVRPSDREVMAVVRGAPRKARVGPTEFRLLHFLVTYPETVHSRDAIRNRLWPAEQRISERTVDAHIRRLRRSLAPVGLQTLVETVLGSGYRLTLSDAA